MRTTAIAVTILLGMLAQTAPLSTQSPRGRGQVEQVNGRAAAGGELLIKFRDGDVAAQLAAIEALTDADSIAPIGRAGARHLRSRSHTANALLRILAAHPSIEYAEPNYIVYALADPTDPFVPQLWGLHNVGQSVNGGLAGRPGADIHATQAWDVSTGSRNHVVAVIDTGIDYTHPDLADNMWTAPAAFTVTVGGMSITCPAGSHGFNAIDNTCDPMDDHYHGTHVAGTIGASANNGIGVAGVNWIASLMGIKFLGANGSGTMADAIKGVEFAIQARNAFAATGAANVRVLSNSWGGREYSQAFRDEVALANAQNMLFVAAAGNDGFPNDIVPMYPASYDEPNVVAVAATTNTDERAWFSNYGTQSVHLGAPGVDIYSTTTGNNYAFLSGTSMAAPHVSGAAALLLSRCALDTAQLKSTLLSTVEPVSQLAMVTITGGRLDVHSAIQSCVAPPSAPPNLTAVAADRKVTLSWGVVVGATSFSVKRALASGGPYTVIASNLSLRTYVDTAVVNATTYYYVVSATNTLGESPDSNEAAATPKAPSDLVISSLTVPSVGGAGTSLTISETTRNQGGGAAAETTTRFYLSANAQLDATDLTLTAVHAVPALGASGTSAVSIPVDIPAGVTAGAYYLIAKADADGIETETYESNNAAARLLYIGPDLSVSSLVAPSVTGAGSTITVTEITKNQGGNPSGASVTRFYLSANATLDAGDVALAGGRVVDPLGAGATSSGPTSLAIPPGTATGSHYLIAKADADASVAESQESNNTAYRQIQIGGDLKVSSMTVPAKAGYGSTIAITETTTNAGGGPVSASVTRFFLSTNATLDAADTPLSGRSVDDLDAGEVSTGTTSTTLPAGLAPGTYYVIAKADGDGTVVETLESNNTAARSIAIGGDLIVSALTGPATGAAGATIVVTDTVLNQGGGSVGQSVTRFYLSPNATLDAADTQLSGNRIVPGLGPSETSLGSSTLTIPAGVTAGLYYVIAQADGESTIAETKETNNTTSRTIAIGPDLTLSSLTVPYSIVVGVPVSVTDTVKNQGAVAAGPSTTRFYLSTNLLLDANDISLSPGRAVLDLAPGVSSTGSTTIVIPSSTAPGNYYLLGKADGDGQVAEGQESNNVAVRAVQVKAGS